MWSLGRASEILGSEGSVAGRAVHKGCVVLQGRLWLELVFSLMAKMGNAAQGRDLHSPGDLDGQEVETSPHLGV